MSKETLHILLSILVPTLVLATMFFYYRKIYYHFKFLGLDNPKLKDKSIVGLIFEPETLLEHFYVLIPVFIKSDRIKEGIEKDLETKISKDTTAFWTMFGLTLTVLTILSVLLSQTS